MDREILYRYFSDRATPEEEKAVMQWIEEDPDNFRELISERELFDLTIMHAEPIKPEPIKRRTGFKRILPVIVRYAAAVAIVAGVWGLLTIDRGAEQANMNIVTVPSGQRVEIVLSDGTTVHMNALSSIEYPPAFDNKNRKVKLSGEAYFKVAHNDNIPFVVETELCDIEVLGTEFNVEAYKGSGKFTTSLIEGSVRVIDRNDAEKSIVLKPSEQLAYNSGGFTVSDIPAHESFLWRSGIISFKGSRFADLLKEFEKYYGITINIGNAALPEKTFSGKIRINEGVEHALNILQNTHRFTYNWNHTRDTIHIK